MFLKWFLWVSNELKNFKTLLKTWIVSPRQASRQCLLIKEDACKWGEEQIVPNLIRGTITAFSRSNSNLKSIKRAVHHYPLFLFFSLSIHTAAAAHPSFSYLCMQKHAWPRTVSCWDAQTANLEALCRGTNEIRAALCFKDSKANFLCALNALPPAEKAS